MSTNPENQFQMLIEADPDQACRPSLTLPYFPSNIWKQTVSSFRISQTPTGNNRQHGRTRRASSRRCHGQPGDLLHRDQFAFRIQPSRRLSCGLLLPCLSGCAPPQGPAARSCPEASSAGLALQPSLAVQQCRCMSNDTFQGVDGVKGCHKMHPAPGVHFHSWLQQAIPAPALGDLPDMTSCATSAAPN